mmetsp:Transcript_160/g.607  ORF Transcript_160/g.607 Transcript_160/m.607 type:complete len:218 (-) Transcript_160:1158-1811(-)
MSTKYGTSLACSPSQHVCAGSAESTLRVNQASDSQNFERSRSPTGVHRNVFSSAEVVATYIRRMSSKKCFVHFCANVKGAFSGSEVTGVSPGLPVSSFLDERLFMLLLARFPAHSIVRLASAFPAPNFLSSASSASTGDARYHACANPSRNRLLRSSCRSRPRAPAASSSALIACPCSAPNAYFTRMRLTSKNASPSAIFGHANFTKFSTTNTSTNT